MSNYRDDKQQIKSLSASNHAFDQLVRAVNSSENDEIPCAECRKHFPVLYELEQQNLQLSADDARFVNHLKQCSYCATEYNILREAMFSYESGTLPELDKTIQFDLSFLDSTPALWLSDAANRVHHLFTEVMVSLQDTAARFDGLPMPLTPQLAPSGAFRSPNLTDEVQVLILPAPDAELSVQLSVGPVTARKAAIAVKLLQIKTAAPIAGLRVALRNAHRQLLVGSVTGEDGSTVFEHLPVGHYSIQVRYKHQDWKIPLVIVESARTAPTAPPIG